MSDQQQGRGGEQQTSLQLDAGAVDVCRRIGRLQRELDALPADAMSKRVAVLEQLIDVQRRRAGDPFGVVRACRAILELDPANAEALAILDEALEASGRRCNRALVVATRAALADEPRERIDLLFRSAELWREQLVDLRAATGALEQIREIDPGNERAIEQLDRLYRRRRDWSRLADLREWEAGRVEGRERVAKLAAAATLAGERAADLPRARELWRSLLEIEPEHPEALQHLQRIAAQLEDWEECCAALETRVASMRDAEQRLLALTELGAIRWHRLRDPGAAADAWERAIKVRPGHRDLWQRLTELYLAVGDWSALEELYVGEGDHAGLARLLAVAADRAGDPDVSIALSLRCAELYEIQIGYPDRAVHHYARVLDIDPAHERAARALVTIHLRRRDWRRLAATLEILAGSGPIDSFLPERVQALAALERSAREQGCWRALFQVHDALLELSSVDDDSIAARGLCLDQEELRGAYEALCAALPGRPAERDLWERLTEFARELGLLGDLAERLGQVFWSGALDDAQRVDLAGWLVAILDGELGLAERAEVYHWQVIRSGRDDGRSFLALERSFGGSARLDDLIDLYEEGLRDPDRADRLELKRKVCRVADELPGDRQRAIAAYRSLLDDAPGDTGATERLERLYEEAGRWADLCDLLSGRLEAVLPVEAIEIRCRLAELAASALGRPELALEWYGQVLLDDPQHEPAREAVEQLVLGELAPQAARILARVYEQLGETARLVSMLELGLDDPTLSDEERGRRLVETAELREQSLGDPAGAFDALCRAFALDPSNAGVRVDLDRLAGQLGLRERYADLLEAAIASVAGDRALRVALLGELAWLAREDLRDPDRAASALLRIVEADPQNPKTALPAIRDLDPILAGQGAWSQLLELLERSVSLERDEVRCGELLRRMAEIAEDQLGDSTAAIARLIEALDRDGSDLLAFAELERLYESRGEWPELLDVLRRHAEVETSKSARQELFQRMSSLASRMKSRRR